MIQSPCGAAWIQYELIGSQPFAIGRTSACFRALNSQQTIVCIKQFSQQPIASGDSDSHEEFAAEITARQTLGHPNILPILDFGYREGPRRTPTWSFRSAIMTCGQSSLKSISCPTRMPFPSSGRSHVPSTMPTDSASSTET